MSTVSARPAPNLPRIAIPALDKCLFVLAAFILAVDPAMWLINSWFDPAYDSSGLVVFLVVAILFAWSVTSRLRVDGGRSRQRRALALLTASTILRLASQILAINTIGGLCLVADVFTIAVLCRLDQRARSLSPAWLAAAFAFCLPLERILQRSIGYVLQDLAADGACLLLSTVYRDLVCSGVRLILQGADILVDLPCSGARTLLLGLLGYCLAAACRRPAIRPAVTGLAITLLTAMVANMLRISLLAIGLAKPSGLAGINVMEQPWHDAIGLLALSIVGSAIVLWAMRLRRREASGCGCPTRDVGSRAGKQRPFAVPGILAGILAVAFAFAVISLPRTPLDVSHAASPDGLPLSVDGHLRRDVALTERETLFFTRYGGWAAKAEYGPHGLMLVHTSSPLRHLHAPDDCLRGLGYDVHYLGARFDPVPTAIYRAVAPDGQRYRIDVSFISDQGHQVTNVAAAVWLWLQGRATSWTALQRISPEALPADRLARFNAAALAALDL